MTNPFSSYLTQRFYSIWSFSIYFNNPSSFLLTSAVRWEWRSYKLWPITFPLTWHNVFIRYEFFHLLQQSFFISIDICFFFDSDVLISFDQSLFSYLTQRFYSIWSFSIYFNNPSSFLLTSALRWEWRSYKLWPITFPLTWHNVLFDMEFFHLFQQSFFISIDIHFFFDSDVLISCDQSLFLLLDTTFLFDMEFFHLFQQSFFISIDIRFFFDSDVLISCDQSLFLLLDTTFLFDMEFFHLFQQSFFISIYIRFFVESDVLISCDQSLSLLLDTTFLFDMEFFHLFQQSIFISIDIHFLLDSDVLISCDQSLFLLLDTTFYSIWSFSIYFNNPSSFYWHPFLLWQWRSHKLWPIPFPLTWHNVFIRYGVFPSISTILLHFYWHPLFVESDVLTICDQSFTSYLTLRFYSIWSFSIYFNNPSSFLLTSASRWEWRSYKLWPIPFPLTWHNVFIRYGVFPSISRILLISIDIHFFFDSDVLISCDQSLFLLLDTTFLFDMEFFHLFNNPSSFLLTSAYSLRVTFL